MTIEPTSSTFKYNRRQVHDTYLTDDQLDRFRAFLIHSSVITPKSISNMADEIMNDLLDKEYCFDQYYLNAGENFLDALDAYKDDHAHCGPSVRIVEDHFINYCLYFAIFQNYMSMAFDGVDFSDFIDLVSNGKDR